MLRALILVAGLSAALAGLSVSPAPIPASGAPVTVTWANGERPDSVIVRLAETLQLLEARFPAAGATSVTFSIPNMRQPLEFIPIRLPRLLTSRYAADAVLRVTGPETSDELAELFRAGTKTDDPVVAFWANPTEPTQGRLALTKDPSSIIVSFTSSSPATPAVQYGLVGGSLTDLAYGTTTTYSLSDMCDKPASNKTNWIDPGFLHAVTLTKLRPATRYSYRFGSAAGGWSPLYTFTTAPEPSRDRPVRFIAFGDMGVSPAQPYAKSVSDSMIRRVTQSSGRDIDFALHIGDIAYARGIAVVWEAFHAEIEPLSTVIPYMVSIGNHEYCWKGQPYKPGWDNYGNDSGGECGVPYFKRFSMPSPPPPADVKWPIPWYSFDYGAVHIAMMSAEHDWSPSSTQYRWLQEDLASVDRSRTPWLVVGGHRPWYQSLDDFKGEAVRDHLREWIEPLFIKFRVDIGIWGHHHVYQRSCPVINGKCNPQGVVHTTIGMAGHSYREPWRPKAEWEVARSDDYGYTTLYAANSTALEVTFWGKNGTAIVDNFWIRK